MADPLHSWPIDRRLHAVNRGLLSLLGWIAGIFLLLWLLDTWATWDLTDDRDATWFASGAIRIAAFATLAVLSFLATYRSQPRQPRDAVGARPGPAVLRLRVVAGVAAALFFGDLAASAFADADGGWIPRAEAAVLALPTLGAIVSVSTGRALLRLWRDGGDGVPAWREPTELEVARALPSVGAHTLWLGTFLVGWLLGDALPSLIPLATAADGATFSLLIEGVIIGGIGALHAAKRELVLAGRLPNGRQRTLDGGMTILGLALSAELGGRLLMARSELGAFSFWVGALVCACGVIAGLHRFLRAWAPGAPRVD